MALWVIGDAQPPRKQLLNIEVLGVPDSDSPLLIKYPDFPLSSESTWPPCYPNRSYRALKVSEDGSGVQAPGLPTQGEAAGEDKMPSACRSGSDGEEHPISPQEAFQGTMCGRRLQEAERVDLDGGRVHGTPVSSSSCPFICPSIQGSLTMFTVVEGHPPV